MRVQVFFNSVLIFERNGIRTILNAGTKDKLYIGRIDNDTIIYTYNEVLDYCGIQIIDINTEEQKI